MEITSNDKSVTYQMIGLEESSPVNGLYVCIAQLLALTILVLSHLSRLLDFYMDKFSALKSTKPTLLHVHIQG
jgi:hypothetical protein